MTGTTNTVSPTLLTFAPMVDSELSRLLLRHYGVAHREDDHLFGWVSLLTLFHGGKGVVPLLYGDGVKLTSPRKIAEHFDPLAPPERRLIPTEGELAQHVEADWQTFNGDMGADSAVYAYYHLLPAKELMAPIFAAPVPPLEAKLTPLRLSFAQRPVPHAAAAERGAGRSGADPHPRQLRRHRPEGGGRPPFPRGRPADAGRSCSGLGLGAAAPA